MRRIYGRIASRRSRSTPASGSSSNRIDGRVISARAIATRCFSPPDSIVHAPIEQRLKIENLDERVEVRGILRLP